MRRCTWRYKGDVNEVSFWIFCDGNGQRAAKQRQARSLLHHSLRTYPNPSTRSFFISLLACQCVFNVCMCTSMCACLLSSDKSNRVIYTGGKSGLQPCKTVCLFPCQYHQYRRWQRAWRERELCSQTLVSLFHTRDASLHSRWIMKTRAPERPCHPGKYENIILAHSWFAKLKENK